MLRRSRRAGRTSPDPLGALDVGSVPPRLVSVVQEAVAARQRWLELVGRLQSGPLKDRLAEIAARIDASVLEVHGTAVRIGEVEGILQTLDPTEATAAYKDAKRRAGQGAAPPEMDALEARFTSVQRMMNLVVDAEEKLRILDARLDAAVARGAELALTADANGLTALDTDLADVVSELGALRAALGSMG